jgi:hypothetical protein
MNISVNTYIVNNFVGIKIIKNHRVDIEGKLHACPL